jgi:phage gpG-like protein
MPVATIEARVSDEVSTWPPAIERGIGRGLESGATIVRDAASASLAAHQDPWGGAHAPPTATTVRLRAEWKEQRGAPLASSFVVRKKDARAFAIRVTGPARRYAYIQQFGNPFNRMFDNDELAPIPARPALPIRENDVVELPPAVHAAVLDAVRQGIAEAIAGGRRR